MTLYLKYRPQKFADLVGQETIKKILINAIKTDRVAHAYLFVGPRGTGKTTTARLLAKSLNCPNRKKGQAEPCNKCSSCQEITGSHSLDVIEIDAASNRGIDDIRELRDKIRYAPTIAKYKIFIIDEVHMLTKESFNALLKTLEEPPAHAIFIMATTEPEKVLDTILSRVQEFDFKRATIKQIEEDLKNIIKAENIKIESEALSLIAQTADGSFRDAESTLDQVSSIDADQITLEITQQVMGIVADKVTGNFIESINKNKPDGAIKLINKIYVEGYNLADFNNRIIEYLRNILLISAHLDLKSTISELEFQRIKFLSKEFESNQILNMINKFLNVGSQMKSAKIPQLLLELAVYEIGENQTNNSKVITQNHNSKLKTEKNNNIKTREKTKIRHQTSDIRHPNSNLPSQISNLKSPTLDSKWLELLAQLDSKNHSLTLLLKDSELVGIENDKLMIRVKFKFYAERIRDGKNYSILSETVEQVFGQKYQIECLVRKSDVRNQMSERTEEQRNIKTKKQKNKEIEKRESVVTNRSNDLANDAMEMFDI